MILDLYSRHSVENEDILHSPVLINTGPLSNRALTNVLNPNATVLATQGEAKEGIERSNDM